MKKGKGKSKGSGYERQISRSIDIWWEEPSGTFWRTTNSGGWREPGDIAPRLRQHQEAVWWPFVAECKFYKKIEFWSLFKGAKKHKLALWWKQVTQSREEAIALGRKLEEAIRLLFFRQNGSKDFVMFTPQDIGAWAKADGINISIEQLMVERTAFPEPVVICTMEDFFRTVSKKRVYAVFNKVYRPKQEKLIL